jgi:cell division protein FtsB
MRGESAFTKRAVTGGGKGLAGRWGRGGMKISEKLKKIAIAAAISLIPLLFCANVWQSFRYSSLKRQIVKLEAEQQDLLEKNKRNIAGISVLESPRRIESLGRGEMGLSRPGAENFVTIRPPRSPQKEADPLEERDADE